MDIPECEGFGLSQFNIKGLRQDSLTRKNDSDPVSYTHLLVTPTQRRSFDENGKSRDTHEDYPEAMRWLAAKENVPLIDLNERTRTLYEAMGVEPSKKAFVHYPAGTYPGQNRVLADNTHFNPYGACLLYTSVEELFNPSKASPPLIEPSPMMAIT